MTRPIAGAPDVGEPGAADPSPQTVHRPDEKLRRRWSFLASPAWIGIIVIALAFAAACFWLLSPWQFDRNSERAARNDAISAAIGQPAVPVTELLSVESETAPDAVWRLVTATGQFVPDHEAFVRLRQGEGGEPVSHVVVPLRLGDGSWVLVDRGYVSFGAIQRGEALPELPAGPTTVTGRVRVSESDPSGRAPVQTEGRTELYAIDPAAIGGPSSLLGPLDGGPLRGYVQLVDGSPGVLTPVEVPQVDAGPFLSYAVQWLVFGATALVGVAVFVYREATGARRRDEPLPYDEDARDESR